MLPHFPSHPTPTFPSWPHHFLAILLFALFLLLSTGAGASPFPSPESKVKVADSLRERVIEELVEDGIVEAGAQNVYFFVLENKIETNGHSLMEARYQKYVTILESLGLQEIERWGFYKSKGRVIFQGTTDAYDHYHFIQHYRSIVGTNGRATQRGRRPASL